MLQTPPGQLSVCEAPLLPWGPIKATTTPAFRLVFTQFCPNGTSRVWGSLLLGCESLVGGECITL